MSVEVVENWSAYFVDGRAIRGWHVGFVTAGASVLWGWL